MSKRFIIVFSVRYSLFLVSIILYIRFIKLNKESFFDTVNKKLLVFQSNKKQDHSAMIFYYQPLIF